MANDAASSPTDDGPLYETEITTYQTSAKDSDSLLSPLHPARVITTSLQHKGSPEFFQHNDGSPKNTLHKNRITKLKKTVTFEARMSQFDRLNPRTGQDTFRGFHTLFWILMAIMTFRSFSNTWREKGQLVSFNFGSLIGKDGFVLALSDGVLVGATFLCVPFMQMIERGWFRYKWSGRVIQHCSQAAYLGLAIRWTFFRQWFWVQSGFLTLHSLSMLMKIHSYCAMNGSLSEKRREYEEARRKLGRILDEHPDGREAVMTQAQNAATEEEESALSTSPFTETFASDTLEASSQSSGTQLKRRRRSQRDSSSAEAVVDSTRPAGMPSSLPESVILDEDLHVLCFHPDKSISEAAVHAADLLDDMTSKGDRRIQYPANLTYANFWDYLVVPTLVYELEYPRTDSVRIRYVLEKTLATFGVLSLILITTEYYIWPVTQSKETSFIGMFLDLCAPMTINYILIFYIIFECICNAFAEISRFADRQFYEDWWNATSFDEFARKWNKPVHTFLLRHVYASTMSTYHVSKFQAAFITFFLSACMHELVMAVVTKKLRFFLFFMQMAQLPMIVVGRAKFFRRNPALGNIMFWCGLLSGFPLLAVGLSAIFDFENDSQLPNMKASNTHG